MNRIHTKAYLSYRRAAALTSTVLLIGWAGVVAAFGVGGAEGGAAPSAAQTQQDAAEGEALFGRICQQCHNTRGHGGKCPQLVRGAWAPGGANSDQLMFDTIAHGRPNTQMGAFAGMLSDAQIWQIVRFLREESVRVQAEDAKAPKSAEEDLWY
ncbi:c-type cytochrome [Nitrogeniibacter aestuarii]|uniref:c-type cytochrome n=1 Tax=Nitrogeniibacter aestuarii TaxID=2815343 RepID=UPI001D1219A6|nr:cytochrome c [Nitrogeniibacter aestuarii]